MRKRSPGAAVTEELLDRDAVKEPVEDYEPEPARLPRGSQGLASDLADARDDWQRASRELAESRRLMREAQLRHREAQLAADRAYAEMHLLEIAYKYAGAPR